MNTYPVTVRLYKPCIRAAACSLSLFYLMPYLKAMLPSAAYPYCKDNKKLVNKCDKTLQSL